MNLQGSYTALRNNSKAAILAAIEIYNKPQISYRDECFSILLVNAWELILKAILSKNKQRIFYPKTRHQSYRTYSIEDALSKVEPYFPNEIPFAPVAQNITLLVAYRNNAIHFYNQRGFNVVIYGLAQTSIINYRDLLLSIFGIDIGNEMTINLLPLAFGSQPDPIEFLKKSKDKPIRNRAVDQFLGKISQITQELTEQKIDTSRFLTVFKVSLQSVKKVSSADVVVGVKSLHDETEPLIIERRVDPNITHPERRRNILDRIGTHLNGERFTFHTFEAIAWKYDIKNKPNLCWQSTSGGITRYSPEVTSFIKRLSMDDLKIALDEYRAYLRKRLKDKK
ncbi:MAG: hypothetical protein DKINENOH_01655 [bacterium]|nr:hypothetical protein [bacterium]